jgi:hypothetical protein
VQGRTVLNYNNGLDHIDDEMDIARILNKIRTLNLFMKMILDTDQRKLLKLRSSQLINSDEDPALNRINTKKVVNKKKML